MSHRLPLHHCQSTYCTNLAGYWAGRIVCIEEPGDSIVGWCNVCDKFVCSRCALKVKLPEREWNNLFRETEHSTHQVYDVIPVMLHCKRCGTVLQKGKTFKIFTVINQA